jgi:hypothetical protein
MAEDFGGAADTDCSSDMRNCRWGNELVQKDEFRER